MTDGKRVDDGDTLEEITIRELNALVLEDSEETPTKEYEYSELLLLLATQALQYQSEPKEMFSGFDVANTLSGLFQSSPHGLEFLQAAEVLVAEDLAEDEEDIEAGWEDGEDNEVE